MRGAGDTVGGEHSPSTCKALIWFPATEEGRATAAEVWLAALQAKLISQLLPSSVEMCRQVCRQVSRQGAWQVQLTGPISTFLPVGDLSGVFYQTAI